MRIAGESVSSRPAKIRGCKAEKRDLVVALTRGINQHCACIVEIRGVSEYRKTR